MFICFIKYCKIDIQLGTMFEFVAPLLVLEGLVLYNLFAQFALAALDKKAILCACMISCITICQHHYKSLCVGLSKTVRTSGKELSHIMPDLSHIIRSKHILTGAE